MSHKTKELLTEITEGDKLIADAGFTCLRARQVYTAHKCCGGNLYVSCTHGRHYLDSQVDDAGYLIGLTKKG